MTLQQYLESFERRELETGDVDGTVRLAVVGPGAFVRDQWRIDPDLAGSGALMDAGVHTATAARFFVDSEATVATPGIDEVREEFAHFGYAVLAGEEPMPDGDVGVADPELLSAVYEAGDRGERVDLD